MREYISDAGLIDKKNMQSISKILGEVAYPKPELEVIKRTILATADFHYVKIMRFMHKPIEKAMSSIRRGRPIVTDARAAFSGIDRGLLNKYGVEVKCFLTADVEQVAAEQGIPAGMLAIEKAAAECPNGIYVIGGDATALFRLLELVELKKVSPDVIIGVPVGFVGTAEAKEELAKLEIPSIITEGQKGGCDIANAVVNAIIHLTEIDED